MTDKKICDCNQGRLPCSCMPAEPGTRETLAAVCTTPAGNQRPGDGVGSCKSCNGRGLVDDGEINCFEDGTPYSNGPVKCVKDCPDCAPTSVHCTAHVDYAPESRVSAPSGVTRYTTPHFPGMAFVDEKDFNAIDAEKYALEDQVTGLQELIGDHETSAEDHKRLVRELDVLLNGEEGAAPQASLCDLVAQVAVIAKANGRPLLEPRAVQLHRSELPPLNDDMLAILGRPNFTCNSLAAVLRLRGQEIRRKSEHEQAAVIHWLLGLYLQHGEKCWEVASAEVQEVKRQHEGQSHD